LIQEFLRCSSLKSAQSDEILVVGSAVEMVDCRLSVKTRLMNVANYSPGVSLLLKKT